MTDLRSLIAHEAVFAGAKRIERRGGTHLTTCGAGSIGGNLMLNLPAHGFRTATIIDRDRVEQRNIGTQPYNIQEIGLYKVKALQNVLYRKYAAQVVITPVQTNLTEKNIGNIIKKGLVVDVFDNHAARLAIQHYCAERSIACVHAGMSGDGYAEVVWNECYRVPRDGGADPCDYPLARNLIDLTVVLLSEAIKHYADEGVKINYYLTLNDLKIETKYINESLQK